MGSLLIAAAYIPVGYFVGVPLAAALDHVLFMEDSDHHKLSVPVAISIWPLVLLIGLFVLPIAVREHFHAKVDARISQQNRPTGA